MHEYGVDSLQANNEIELINQEVQKLCKKLKNSLVIITADHGQIKSMWTPLLRFLRETK